ncbi:diaminopimelate epimerase [uncultured Sphingomonas sp.]|uniref:diaminopimelate epimerase n=1 Tax=uncultured Sphingomonas sp. TaxID=158754 RepID=UPI002600062D|nr:diaminopimelate epimerase [uncultured Sphingomonas sp.]
MRFGLVKCHGSGNDFPMIDARDLSLGEAEWAGVARALADRSGPVGGDGLLLLVPGDDRSAFGMVMRNSDGSEAETCLNGVRCVARAGFEALGMTEATVRLKTSHADAVQDADLAPGVYTVRETAGPAGLSTAAWPIHGAPEQLVEAVLPMLDGEKRFTAVTMPNPHLVHFVETVDEAELVRLGEICEAAPDWLPQRANVSFVEVRGNALFVRTFERGVGLTDSCGSAMAASTYAACLTRRIAWDVPTVVFNRGGLVRAFAGEDGMVTLSGNATYEWAGSVDVDLTSETASDLVVERRYPDEIAAWEAAKRG